MIWRIYDLVTTAEQDFVYNMPTLALTTTLELWLCIIIGCIPTLAPIFRTYISPLVTKLSSSRKSTGPRSTPRNIVTFGGGRRGPRQSSYSNIMGSEEVISEGVAPVGRDTRRGDTGFADQAFTTTLISSDSPAQELELKTIPNKNSIRVQLDVNTQFSH